MITHLNGMPGSGKLAKILAAELHAELLDNHSLIDIITLTHPRGSAQYLTAPEQAVECTLEELLGREPLRPVVSTNALAPESADDRHGFEPVVSITARWHRRLFAETTPNSSLSSKWIFNFKPVKLWKLRDHEG